MVVEVMINEMNEKVMITTTTTLMTTTTTTTMKMTTTTLLTKKMAMTMTVVTHTDIVVPLDVDSVQVFETGSQDTNTRGATGSRWVAGRF